MQGPSFWFDTRIYIAVAAALLTVIVFYNQYVAMLGVILLYVLYLYGHERYIQRQKAMTAYLESLTEHVDQASCYALQNLPVGMAIVGTDGRLRWRNKLWAAWGGEQADIGQSVQGMWPNLSLEKLQGKESLEILHLADKHYQIIYRPLPENAADDSRLTILYATDITASETVRAECRAAMPVLAYIQLDNYGDVLQGLTENQRTSILTEVNRRLVEWVTVHNSFLKKYADDMYLALFSRQALAKLLLDKFDILDKIRSIHGGNKIPVTLSMGVAADEASMALLGQRAQAGLDLALSRGGDQVAVHVEGKVQFYGGKTKAAEKSTRVKARIVAQAIRESIGASQLVLVMGHAGEDFDSLGAAIGVAKMARHLGKRTNIVVSQPGLALEKLQEIIPDYEEYAGLFISPSEARDLSAEGALLFVVDTHRPELTAAPELLIRFERIIVIDHHRRAETFIANSLLVYLEPSASSTSELVTELLTYYDDNIGLNRLEASALYAGILVDTKNFAVQTGVRTFEAASFLRRVGADPSLVRQLFRIDFDILKSRAEIINNTEMLPGGIVIATCPLDVKNAQIVASQAADMLLNIEDVEVCFVLFPIEGGTGISARSQGTVNVQLIMEQLGGGGHQTVAGAQMKNISIEEAKQQVIHLVGQYMEESEEHEINSTGRSEKSR